MKSKAALFIIIFSVCLEAQVEIERWGRAENPYLIRDKSEQGEYNSGGGTAGELFVNSAVSVYRLLISDQDGDNCPFYPSCSRFFTESVRITSLPQGILMFGDRFTRDMNIFNRKEKYPLIREGRLYDPPELYTLESPDIHHYHLR